MSESNQASGFIPPAIEELNQWLSGYEVLDLIACGGMGAVYRARQISLDRNVAIKVLPPELAVDEIFRKSFEAEGKAMAKLTHSNLVGVYDFGEISEMLYLVIEFVEGSTLFDSKADAVIDPEVAVTLIRAVSSGLAEAHHNGIVHRDIKPANILINHDLVPKLGDFGLAVPDSDIESGLMMGTPAYLAPEVMADSLSASFASDVYALGVILYEMLTGDLLEGGDEMDLSRVPALGDLQKIVRKAVDSKPLLRYQNGEEFEKALGNWIRKPKAAGLAMNAGAPTIRPNVTPTVTQASGGNSGIFLGFVALLVVGGLAWFLMEGDSKPEDESPEESIVTLPEISDESPVIPPEKTMIEKVATVEALRSEQVKVLRELSQRLQKELAQNRGDFLQAAGVEGESFLKVVPDQTTSLPRHLMVGEAEVSPVLLGHLQEFATSRQGEIERKHRLEVSSLHRDSLRDLRATKEELPENIHSSWEAWVEWLGYNPVEMSHASAVGQWQLSSDGDGFDLHVSATGKKTITTGEKTGEVFLTSDDLTGEILLNDPARPGLRFPWRLRWRGDRLEGKDLDGETRLLRLVKFDYSTLLKVSGEMAESEEDLSEMKTFRDPEVAALTKKYREALVDKIEPLEKGYFKILNASLEKVREEVDGTAVVQIEKELEWVAALKWREGFTQLEFVGKPGELPSHLIRQQAVFMKEFKKRFEPIQRTYLTSLKAMLRGRKFKGRTDVGDIEKAIKMLQGPEGAVRARFVKIESLPDDGIRNATITTIDILDGSGKKLPHEKFSKVKASSHQDFPDGSRNTDPEKAVDGDPATRWGTEWKSRKTTFPHWLSFDLGEESWITGFELTSRGTKYWNRETDITNWLFYISLDGRKWTVVAKGNFPKGAQLNKHLGFEEIE